MIDLDRVEAQARAALTYERSTFDEAERMYVQPATSDEAEPMCCPLCDGDGEVDGARYDATEEQYAATVVAYGIGKGLGLAEQWVENAPRDMLALVAELRAARAEIERLHRIEAAAREWREAVDDPVRGDHGPAADKAHGRHLHAAMALREAVDTTEPQRAPCSCESCRSAADERADVVAWLARQVDSLDAKPLGSDDVTYGARLMCEDAIDAFTQGAHVGAAKGGERG